MGAYGVAETSEENLDPDFVRLGRVNSDSLEREGLASLPCDGCSPRLSVERGRNEAGEGRRACLTGDDLGGTRVSWCERCEWAVPT